MNKNDVKQAIIFLAITLVVITLIFYSYFNGEFVGYNLGLSIVLGIIGSSVLMWQYNKLKKATPEEKAMEKVGLLNLILAFFKL